MENQARAGVVMGSLVGLEGLALFGGLVLVNGVLERPDFAVPWIAFVVGVHFILLARAWGIRLYFWLGDVQTMLGIVGFALAMSGSALSTVNLVSGVLSGVALYVTVAIGVLRSRPVRVRS